MKILAFCYIKLSGSNKKIFLVLITMITLTTVYFHTALNPLSPRSSCNVSRTVVFEWGQDDLLSTQADESSRSFRFDPEVQKRNASYAHSRHWVGFPTMDGFDCESSLKHMTFNKSYPKTVKRILPAQFIQDSRNCSSFIDIYGYRRHPTPSAEEREFPIAFSILFHKDLDQLHFLLRAIYHPHNVYCLSADIKSSVELLRAIRSIARCLPNVFVSSKLENIVYGGYTRLLADINCFHDLIKHPVTWKYVINSPGQQFPLRTNLEIVKILKLLNGTNDILGVTGDLRNVERFLTKWKYVINDTTGDVRMVQTNEKNEPPPGGLEVVKCSAYGAFSRPFIQFVLDNLLSRELLNWTRSVYSPDELYWATLNYNTVSPAPGGFKGVPSNRPWLTSFSTWPWDNWPCHSMYVREICIFGLNDLPTLMSSYALFANKFYINHEPIALHCLDQYIYNQTIIGEPRDTSYYQKHLTS